MAENPVTDKAAAMQAFLQDQPIPGLTDGAASAPPTPASVVEAPPAPPSVPEPVASPLAAPVTPQQAAEVGFIGAKQGEVEFRIPNDVLIPLKRHDKVEWVPAEQAWREAMMTNDVKLSKQELATQRQAFQRDQEQIAVEKARLAAEADWQRQEAQRLAEAQSDPVKWEAYQNHLQALATNPVYRQQVEQAQRARGLEAENAVYRTQAEAAEVQRGIDASLAVIDTLKAKYPGVSVDAVRQRFGAVVTLAEAQSPRQLRWGEGPLTPQAIEQVFQQEADHLAGTIAPVNAQMAELQKQLADLKAAQEAALANAQTTHAVKRAGAPNTKPTGTPAVAAGEAPKRIPAREMPDHIRQWIEQP